MLNKMIPLICFAGFLVSCASYPQYTQPQVSPEEQFFAELDKKVEDCLIQVGELNRTNALARVDCIDGNQYRALRSINYEYLDIELKHFLDKKRLAEKYQAGKLSKDKYLEEAETITVNKNALVNRIFNENQSQAQAQMIQLKQLELNQRQTQAIEEQANAAKEQAGAAQRNATSLEKSLKSNCTTYRDALDRIVTNCN